LPRGPQGHQFPSSRLFQLEPGPLATAPRDGKRVQNMDEFNNQQNNDNNYSWDNQPTSQNTLTPAPSTIQELAPVLALVPADEFRRLGVVPTQYDQANCRLKLVSGTPVDDNRRNELSARLPNINIEWHQVDEHVYSAACQRITSEPSSRIPQIGCELHENLNSSPGTNSDETPHPENMERPFTPISNTAFEPAQDSDVPPAQKTVLFVTPTGNISQHLMFAFSAEKCRTVTVKSLALAFMEVEHRPVESIFIHENLYKRKDQFVQRMQALRPEIPIRYYRSDLSLLLNDTRNQTIFDLVRQNLTLFSRINDSRGSAFADHAAAVARFADRMAVRLGVPDHCRLMVSTAAYLHNMAEDNLRSTMGLQQTDIIGLSASRLESWDYPPLVIGMLRRMYRPAPDFDTVTDCIEELGGYILTAADAFCHLWPDYSTLGRELDLIQKKLEDELRQKAPALVINTLVDVICDDCTARLLRPNAFSVHLFESRGTLPAGLVDALHDADFGVTVSSNIDECVKRCGDLKADSLIICDSGSIQDIYDTLMSLVLRGLAIDQLHTVLLLDPDMVTEALRLLPHGVEDILPATARHQAVLTKLARIKNRLDEQSRNRVSAMERLGTHGSLADMSLTDILESVRGNRRPTRISVTAYGNQLTVYIDQGKVIAAECGDSAGPDALLSGVSWRQGIWNIEAIEAAELPEPNINRSIDAVLIEACTKLDQAIKDEPLYDLK